MRGLTTRLTSSGIPVLRIHYRADESKTPAWAESAAVAFGGLNSARWRKEMEIEWGALGGMRLFPQWDQWMALGKIVIPPFDPVGYKLYASYDHGWRNPLAYHVWGLNGDGDIVGLWELYGSGIGVANAAKLILGQQVTLADGRRLAGNPFAGREAYRVADPTIWAQDQAMSDGTNKAIAELFRRAGVVFIEGERGGDSMVAEWLHGHFWKDPAAPLLRITTDCPKLVWELGQQRHRELSGRVALNRDQPEELVDKDNHAWDGMKMFLKRFPPKVKIKAAAQSPNSFSWWQKMAKGGAQRQSASFRV